MITITITPELNKKLDEISKTPYNDERKTKSVSIVDQIIVARNNPPVQKTTSSQRRSKYDSSCGGCGGFIAAGSVCWITVGESPRCSECGRHEDAK
jgi:hypothetical protein